MKHRNKIMAPTLIITGFIFRGIVARGAGFALMKHCATM